MSRSNCKRDAHRRTDFTGERYQQAQCEIKQLAGRRHPLIPDTPHVAQQQVESAVLHRLLHGAWTQWPAVDVPPPFPFFIQSVCPSEHGLRLVVPAQELPAFGAALAMGVAAGGAQPPADEILIRDEDNGPLLLTTSNPIVRTVELQCSRKVLFAKVKPDTYRLASDARSLRFAAGRAPRLRPDERAVLSSLLRRIALFAERDRLDWLFAWHEWVLSGHNGERPQPPSELESDLTDNLFGLQRVQLRTLGIEGTSRQRNAGRRTTTSKVAKVQSEARPWRTVAVERVVLVAVHTVTCLMRLEDILPLIDIDARVQLVFTQVPDEFGDGVEQRLRSIEVRVIPWEEATQLSFDLVISASPRQMERVRAERRIAMPHGAAHYKLWPLQDWPGDSDDRPVHGLDRRLLLHDGRPVFDAIVLPRPDHLATLERQCPESLPATVLAGDPCFDRLAASAEYREVYRSRLGVRPAQKLVAIASTWGRQSLLATQRELLLRLPQELPANHRVIATLDPAVWAEHGARQVRSWLHDVREAGVDLIDVGEDWRGLVTAADVLIADHTSVAVYAAAVGIPLLLSHFASDEVAPDSIMAELARLSPMLDHTQPLYEQLLAARTAAPNQWITSERPSTIPGLSASVLRQTLYRLLALEEPDLAARWLRVPVPRLIRDIEDPSALPDCPERTGPLSDASALPTASEAVV